MVEEISRTNIQGDEMKILKLTWHIDSMRYCERAVDRKRRVYGNRDERRSMH
jgi:hypothetical protein